MTTNSWSRSSSPVSTVTMGFRELISRASSSHLSPGGTAPCNELENGLAVVLWVGSNDEPFDSFDGTFASLEGSGMAIQVKGAHKSVSKPSVSWRELFHLRCGLINWPGFVLS